METQQWTIYFLDFVCVKPKSHESLATSFPKLGYQKEGGKTIRCLQQEKCNDHVQIYKRRAEKESHCS